MSSRFLNERLITSRRFAPGTGKPGGGAAGEAPGEGGGASPAGRPSRGEVGIPPDVMRREAGELRRLREELVHQLAVIREECRREAAGAALRLERIEQAAKRLEALPEIPEIPGEDAAALGPFRRTLEGVRIELIKTERERGADAPVSTPIVDLESLTFGQLARLGFAFTWPVAVAILLAAGIVGITVVIVFAV